MNDELRQEGNTNLMIFSIPSLIEYVSHYMTLEEGDLILTGTPAGVSQVVENDRLYGELYDNNDKLISTLETTVVENKLNVRS